ncbi:hypothetical protein D3C74_48640 [compost metagenome]
MNKKERYQEELDVLALSKLQLKELTQESQEAKDSMRQLKIDLDKFNKQRGIRWEDTIESKPLSFPISVGSSSWDELVNQSRAKLARQANFSDFLTDREISDCFRAVQDMRKELNDSYPTRMLDELRDNFLQSLIGPFGLSIDMLRAADGGTFPTVHNANQGIIPNDPNGEKLKHYNIDYNRENYAPKSEMGKKRKERFKDESPIIDGYTKRTLEREGGSHIEHVVSASETHNDDWMRLYVSLEKRKEFVNSEDNIIWTESSLNESKGDRDLITWMNKPSKKDPEKTNAEYYGVDKKKAKEYYYRSHLAKNALKLGSVTKEVVVQCGKTSVVMGLRKALGYILYEFSREIFNETREVLCKRKKRAVNLKEELIQRFKKIVTKIASKWEEIIKQFFDGAIAGFLSEMIVFIINTFFSTMKRIVRIIKEGLMSLVSMIRFLLNPPKDILHEEIYQQCMKMGMAILITSGGVLLEEIIDKFLLAQVWAAPMSGFLAPILSGLLTGLTLGFVMYGIDTVDLFGAIEKRIDQQMSQKIMDELWVIESEFGAIALS